MKFKALGGHRKPQSLGGPQKNWKKNLFPCCSYEGRNCCSFQVVIMLSMLPPKHILCGIYYTVIRQTSYESIADCLMT